MRETPPGPARRVWESESVNHEESGAKDRREPTRRRGVEQICDNLRAYSGPAFVLLVGDGTGYRSSPLDAVLLLFDAAYGTAAFGDAAPHGDRAMNGAGPPPGPKARGRLNRTIMRTVEELGAPGTTFGIAWRVEPCDDPCMTPQTTSRGGRRSRSWARTSEPRSTGMEG